jgi:hypothetical protein
MSKFFSALLGGVWVVKRGSGGGVKEGGGQGGRNEPKIVCTYEFKKRRMMDGVNSTMIRCKNF